MLTSPSLRLFSIQCTQRYHCFPACLVSIGFTTKNTGTLLPFSLWTFPQWGTRNSLEKNCYIDYPTKIFSLNKTLRKVNYRMRYLCVMKGIDWLLGTFTVTIINQRIVNIQTK